MLRKKMNRTKPKLLSRLHPEGIPWPMSLLYNRLSTIRAFQAHYELVARDILEYQPEGKILDIGTGPGWLLIKLHRLNPKLDLAGVDISPAMTAVARKNLTRAGMMEAVEIRENGPACLPYDDEVFDVVVSTGSIHHWKEPVAELNEIHRVLKFGGRAFIYDIVRDTPLEVKKEAARNFGRLRTTLLWLHAFEEPFYLVRNLEDLVGSSALELTETRFLGAFCRLVLIKPAG